MTISWRAPANIAFIKYWGKKAPQIPANPSLSLTLEKCWTQTKLNYPVGSGKKLYQFEGRETAFSQKALNLIQLFCQQHKELNNYDLFFESQNSFPHSAGIASSASSMAALALCLLSLKQEITGEKIDNFFQQASYWARLGSGSACRSLWGGIVQWEQAKWAEPCLSIHQNFQTLQDTILVISSEPKSLSSSAGHELMNQHPERERRYQLARSRFDEMQELLCNGDLMKWGALLEQEALDLHALMLQSGHFLLKPQTLDIIQQLRDWRQQAPIFFTLDAGPNLHLLYPKSEVPKVQEFVAQLKVNKILWDQVGLGPKKLGEGTLPPADQLS